MKKLSLIIFMLVTVSCVVLQASPNGHDQGIKVRKAGDIFKVTYQSPVECRVKVTITDAKGEVLFTEKVDSHGGFTRPYNFSQLPKGDYTIQVEDLSGSYSEKLSYRDKKWVTHVGKIKSEENKYIVSIPGLGKQEVIVYVYNQFQELVFTDHVFNDGDFAKVYHLKDLEGATIQLVNQFSGETKVFIAE